MLVELKCTVIYHVYVLRNVYMSRYHSRMALPKVRILTWLRNCRMVTDHPRIAQGILLVLSMRYRRCPAQSRNSLMCAFICFICFSNKDSVK